MRMTKKEFLIDADIEFSKIKHILGKNPDVLIDDPRILPEYVQSLALMRKKRLLELAANPFSPDESFTHYLPEIQKEKVEAEREARMLARKEHQDKFERSALDEA